MSGPAVANGHPPEEANPKPKVTETSNGHPKEPTQKRPRKKKGKNYNQIHSKPLPLDIHPLPAFHPSNPISLLRLCYVWLSHILAPPSSHPQQPYLAVFRPESRSIEVTDARSIRALWEMGFFGKGSLSRSESSWLDREKARLKAERLVVEEKAKGGGTAEEATMARRAERRQFKLERARLERERIERQRAVEEGRMTREEFERLAALDEGKETDAASEVAKEGDGQANGHPPEAAAQQAQVDGIEANAQPPELDDSTVSSIEVTAVGRVPDAEILEPAVAKVDEPPLPNGATTTSTKSVSPQDDEADEADEAEPDIKDEEHLQLTLEEAFFLSYALGVLHIITPTNTTTTAPPTPMDLLSLFVQHSTFHSSPAAPQLNLPKPSIAVNNQVLHARAVSHAITSIEKDPTASALAIPASATPSTSPSPSPTGGAAHLILPDPDNPFLLNYVVYHHFRSLGWVVRPGLKFGVDYLLYNRGPVFSHAEFAVLVLPAYTNEWWSTRQGKARRRVKEEKDWWWLHCVNRVQSQVKKSLVLCYVDVPSPLPLTQSAGETDVGRLLRRYKVREFVVRRWVPNRSRD